MIDSRPAAHARCTRALLERHLSAFQEEFPEAFRDALTADTNKAIRAVILTHSETSTGVINDLETISGYVRAHGTAITIADCVTSLGATDVPMDAWGVDVVASGSQKGYMLPPGLSFVAMVRRID